MCQTWKAYVLKLFILLIMKAIANLNTRKGLCRKTSSNLGYRQLWQFNSGNKVQRCRTMSELVADAGQECWGTLRKSTSKSSRHRRCQGQWWRAESPTKGRGIPWTGNGHSSRRESKTNQEPSSLWPSMMKSVATGNNEYSNAKTAQEQETGLDDKLAI